MDKLKRLGRQVNWRLLVEALNATTRTIDLVRRAVPFVAERWPFGDD